jgi:hypothetical protein
MDDENKEVQIIGGRDQEQIIMQSIETARNAWKNMAMKTETIKDEEEMPENKNKKIAE